MDWTQLVSVSLFFILLIVFLLKTNSSWNNNSQNLPPRPRILPFLGNLHIMDMKRPHRTMLKLSKVYGPVFRIQLGCQKIVVLAGYKTVKEALVNHADAFAERPNIHLFDEISEGFGILFSHGENWKLMRRFTLSALRDYGMGKRNIEDKIIEECRILIKAFESYEGQPFENTAIMNSAVGNIIMSFIFGKRYQYEDPTFQRLINLINENVRLAGSPSVLFYNMFPLFGFLFGARNILLNNKKELFGFLKTTFIEHLKVLDENDQRSFIDSFLVRQAEEKRNKAERYFHNENLTVVVNNLFAGGMETTSTTLRWAILLMMKYPDIQNKVYEEISRIIGSAQPRIEHRAKMPYTDAVIHEAQRFADIIPGNVVRATTVDITFKGFFIPKGTHIVPLLTSVLHDESQWEKPHEFYPEHFLDSEGKFVKRDAFMPFSAGRRICLGETLAKTELFLFFTSLLQRFTFQTPHGISKEDLDLTPAIGFTAPPMPYKSCALPRS